MAKKWFRQEPGNRYSRRQFLAQTGAAGMSLTSSRPIEALFENSLVRTRAEDPPADNDLTRLEELFMNPPPSTRPMTRWFWFGGAVTREEITRELTLMRDAGLRGVELQPVYPLSVDDPQRDIRNTPYFSRDWFELIRHTAGETRRLGMQFDFTLGSGWPYGGPFIPIDLAARRLQVLSQDVAGPREFHWDLHPLIPDSSSLIAALAAPVLPSGEPEVGPDKVIVIPRVDPWKAPPGHWRVMVFLDSPTRMQVKRPTVGMEGYVLDHFNRQALDLFLEAVGNRTLRELREGGLPPFTSVFCDSLEVYGADWTPSLLRVFRERRGYDLTPFLPALWQDAGPLTPRVRYDYHLTLSELIVSNFFQRLSEWSERNGTTARIQAHGAMGDVMQGYAQAHIPEGERIEGGDRYFVDIAHRRLASSAAHVYLKPVVSAETYTWLRHPLFTATLEMMKAVTDSQFLDGINQIVNHGYPYSPPQAGQPGWTFYASCVINHNNIWWRHYPHLTRYIQRTAAMLQQGISINPVAVYLPLADVYARYGAGGLNIDEELERYLGAGLFRDLRRAGYDFDFINDDALTRLARVKQGELHVGTGIYSVAIIPSIDYMPPESLDRLTEYVQTGGILIFVGDGPKEAPGLIEQDARTARLRKTLGAFWQHPAEDKARMFSWGKGKVYKATDNSDAVVWLQAQFPPDFTILEARDQTDTALKAARENVGFVHRKLGSVDLYFLSNVSGRRHDLRIQFDIGQRVPQRWDPETGTLQKSLAYRFVEPGIGGRKATELEVGLDPFESCFIMFAGLPNAPLVTRTSWPGCLKIEQVGNHVEVTGLLPRNGDYWVVDTQGRSHEFRCTGLPEPCQIPGPWQLRLGSVKISLARLLSWTELPEGVAYSGWGDYETEFQMADPGKDKDIEWTLDLGAVHETAEAFLNDVPLGVAWKGKRRLECGKTLKQGRNQLRIQVGNLWINKVLSLPPNDFKEVAETYGIRWGMDEAERLARPLPSGLLGPVQLIPYRRWTERF